MKIKRLVVIKLLFILCLAESIFAADFNKENSENGVKNSGMKDGEFKELCAQLKYAKIISKEEENEICPRKEELRVKRISTCLQILEEKLAQNNTLSIEQYNELCTISDYFRIPCLKSFDQNFLSLIIEQSLRQKYSEPAMLEVRLFEIALAIVERTENSAWKILMLERLESRCSLNEWGKTDSYNGKKITKLRTALEREMQGEYLTLINHINNIVDELNGSINDAGPRISAKIKELIELRSQLEEKYEPVIVEFIRQKIDILITKLQLGRKKYENYLYKNAQIIEKNTSNVESKIKQLKKIECLCAKDNEGKLDSHYGRSIKKIRKNLQESLKKEKGIKECKKRPRDRDAATPQAKKIWSCEERELE